ncbi:hypothetical protein Tco_0369367 [Tanacetum coccineum]
MVRRSGSLRYETGEKKVNEVDFISQGVELIGCRGGEGGAWVMVVKEIDDGFVKEMERSWNDGLSKTLMMEERKIKMVVKYESWVI